MNNIIQMNPVIASAITWPDVALFAIMFLSTVCIINGWPWRNDE